MATQIILEQLLIFGILALVGASAYWGRIITPEVRTGIAKLVIDVTLPFLILFTFSGMDGNETLLKNGLLVFTLTFVYLGVLYAVGSLSSRVQGLKGASGVVHSLHTMFGNIVFLAFPLLDALFPGGTGVFYAAVFQLASNTTLFTLGAYKLSAGEQKGSWRSMLNANTVALLLGLVIMVTGFTLPKPVMIAFEGLGRSTSPLSMVYIGALLAGMNVRTEIKKPSVYLVSFNKLLLVPIVLGYLTVLGLRALGIEMAREALFVLVMQAAMPCQTILVVMAHRYKSDHQLAATNLFVSTILSIATLPVVYIFMEWIV
jgi:malate permease and related proteins